MTGTVDIPGLTGINDAPWALFEAEWYQQRYAPDVSGVATTPSALMGHYLDKGRSRGYSPNPFFDETWYLNICPEAAHEIQCGHLQSGFEHYCIEGYRTRSPHWLFDLDYYRERYDDLTPALLSGRGLVNHYAHFLTFGVQEGRIGHRFFWPDYYRAAMAPADRQAAMAKGAFTHFLLSSAGDDQEKRTTPYFSPGWYRETYPAVDAEIRSGAVRNALEHYLTNETPAEFNPNPIFSESVYLRRNSDVAQALAERRLRSGYHHFIAQGVREHRFFSRAIDLAKYTAAHALVRADLKDDSSLDPYLHLLTIGTALGLSACPRASMEAGLGEDRSKVQFRAEAELVALAHARHMIDFTVTAPPAVSVIMVLHNHFALTIAALASLRDNVHDPLEVILVDSGSTDETLRIETVIKGAKLVRLAENEGFVRACNAGLGYVTAETVLFLNNDIRLSPGAIATALRKLHSDVTIGAVGGKVVRAHGVLQEAGCVIWRDGTTAGVLRDCDALDPAANYVRDADYCSAVFLLVPTALVKALGGFDDDFAPSYYEDTDLCVRIRQLGFRVVYDPAVVSHHLEYGSVESTDEAEAAMDRGRQTFLRKHAGWLTQQPERPQALTNIAVRSSGKGRILFIDDTIPMRDMGSGFVRANDLIREMVAIGYDVTVFPINASARPVFSIYADFCETVEIMHGHTIDGLEAFLEQNPRRFNIIWVSRTHNLRLVKDAIKDLRDPDGRPVGVIVDTEAVASLRNRAKQRVKPHIPQVLPDTLDEEFRHVRSDSQVVCVTEAEQRLLHSEGFRQVRVLGHVRKLDITPKSFNDRRGLLILGAIHDADSPNHDALSWFVEAILPLVTQELGPDVLVSVAGYQGEAVDLSALAEHPQLKLLGCVPQTRPLYDVHRVFVAPTRYAAGVAYKIHEAASFGLPIVTTSLIAGQTGWNHGTELLAADETDPQAFARQLIALYRDERLWQRLQHNAAARLRLENNENDYRRALGSILANVGSPKTSATPPAEGALQSFGSSSDAPSVQIA